MAALPQLPSPAIRIPNARRVETHSQNLPSLQPKLDGQRDIRGLGTPVPSVRRHVVHRNFSLWGILSMTVSAKRRTIPFFGAREIIDGDRTATAPCISPGRPVEGARGPDRGRAKSVDWNSKARLLSWRKRTDLNKKGGGSTQCCSESTGQRT